MGIILERTRPLGFCKNRTKKLVHLNTSSEYTRIITNNLSSFLPKNLTLKRQSQEKKEIITSYHEDGGDPSFFQSKAIS